MNSTIVRTVETEALREPVEGMSLEEVEYALQREFGVVLVPGTLPRESVLKSKRYVSLMKRREELLEELRQESSTPTQF
jgi:hypothetical protein